MIQQFGSEVYALGGRWPHIKLCRDKASILVNTGNIVNAHQQMSRCIHSMRHYLVIKRKYWYMLWHRCSLKGLWEGSIKGHRLYDSTSRKCVLRRGVKLVLGPIKRSEEWRATVQKYVVSLCGVENNQSSVIIMVAQLCGYIKLCRLTEGTGYYLQLRIIITLHVMYNHDYILIIY